MFQILSQINTFQFSNSTFQNNIRSIHMKQCFLGYAFPSNTRKTKHTKNISRFPEHTKPTESIHELLTWPCTPLTWL